MRYNDKQEVNVFMIMEDMEVPAKAPEIRNVVNDGNLFYVEFYTVLQDFLRVNRNRRLYPGKLMIPAFQAEHIQELLRNQSLFCEAGHPDTDEIKRCLTIDPKNICACILDMDTDERYNKGTVRTIDDGGGVGTKMTKLILQGTTPAFSLRALSKLKTRADGASEITNIPHIVTYDWVILPSHKEAYMDRTKEVKIINKNPYTGKNNTAVMVKPITESNLHDIELFVKEESNAIRIASNALNVCKEGLIVTDDYKYAIIKEGNKTFHIPIEQVITREITNYMANL